MNKSLKPRQIVVRSIAAGATRGIVEIGALRFPCALGRSGCRARKREGDGATPLGRWPLRYGYYRTDRLRRPASPLRMSPLHPDAGWCDAAADRNYNRPVRHPYPASAERMWRPDDLYDIVLVIGHNDRPRTRGCGSAIFMHLARKGLSPTEGCIALTRRDLLILLRHVRPGTRIHIRP